MAKLPKGLYQRGSIFWTKVYKTEAIYRRYAIVSDADLQEAAKKLAAVSTSGDYLVTVAPACS